MRLYNPGAYAVIVYPSEAVAYDKKAADGTRLGLDFEVTATTDTDPNQGVFTLYNVSESSRRRIATEAKSIIIYAGFDGIEKQIFYGDITSALPVKANPGWAINITAGDGFKAYTEERFSKTYAAGTDKETIVRDIIDAMKLAGKTAVDSVKGVMAGDITLDGLAKDGLTKILGSLGAEWSIQDNEIRITGTGKPIDNEAILINSDTGLLEPPVITDTGINVRMLLNPDLRPGKLVKVQSSGKVLNISEGTTFDRARDSDGFYLVKSVSFVGNNYGGNFDAIFEADRYGQ